MTAIPDYLQPGILPGLKTIHLPIGDATEETLQGYGELIHEPNAKWIEIVHWLAQRWRTTVLSTGPQAQYDDVFRVAALQQVEADAALDAVGS